MASMEGVIDATSKYWLETLPPSIMETVRPLRAPFTLMAGGVLAGLRQDAERDNREKCRNSEQCCPGRGQYYISPAGLFCAGEELGRQQ